MSPPDPGTSQRDASWYDLQYDNRRRVPNFAEHFERWRSSSAAARSSLRCDLDVPFTPQRDVTLDLFPAAQRDAPVLLFLHGGYWRSLDKADFSFVAPPFVAAGISVVVSNYALCPAVTIDTISLQAALALAWIHRQMAVPGRPPRCVVAGHSAGGHLAAMLLACDGRRLAADLPHRLTTRAVSISGLYDLAPIAASPALQADLRLTPEQIRRNSPAGFSTPREGRLCSVVGGSESEEFLRQNRLIRERWGERAVPVCEVLPGRDHFTALDTLVDPAAPLHRQVLDWSVDAL